MALEKIKRISGKAVFVSGNDIDTDRIIPARYLKCVTFDGLGEFLFQDVRFGEDGKKTNHVLNDERFKDANIMIVESNFGSGSSREHAPQSIKRAGFDAIIGESFAEIFYGNSLTLGIPCLEADKAQLQEMAALVEADPDTKIEIDIENETVSLDGKVFKVAIKPSAKDALLSGMWDAIAELLANSDKVDETAARLPYLS